jgi:hypothetical protein
MTPLLVFALGFLLGIIGVIGVIVGVAIIMGFAYWSSNVPIDE